jgi:hypothetical protein
MHTKTRRLLVVSLAVVAAGGVAAGGVAVAARGPAHSDAASDSTATATQAATSASEPSSSESIAPATATRTATGSDTPQASSPAPGAKAQVVLAYADWDPAGARLEAAGFVSGLIQSGGTCTLTATLSGRAVTATSDAEADATTTNCGQLTLPADQLVPGEWDVTLSYRSATHSGTSQPTTVTVPAR